MRVALAALAVFLLVAVPAAAASRGPNDAIAFFTWDSKQLVFQRGLGGDATVWVTGVGHGRARELAAGAVRGTRPGGDEVLVERDGSSYVYTLEGSTVAGFPGHSATWSPDGGQIAFLRDGTLHVASATGSHDRDLGVPVVSPGWDVAGPVWSPDGASLVIAAREGSWGSRLVTVDVRSAKAQTIFRAENQNVNPTWSSQGQIAFETHAHGAWQIWTMDADGGNAHALVSDGWNNRYPQWAPNGRDLVFISNRGAHPGGALGFRYALEIWLGNDPKPRDAGRDARLDEPPHWSPTGVQIAYATGGVCNRFGIAVVTLYGKTHRRSNGCARDPVR